MIDPQDIAVARSVDLVDLIAKRNNVPLRRCNGMWRGRCYKCDADEFHVNARFGFFHCFACRWSGTPIDWEMRFSSVDFAWAVDRLVQIAKFQREAKGDP